MARRQVALCYQLCFHMFPYSVILFGLGSVLICIAAFLAFIDLVQAQKEQTRVQNVTQIPTPPTNQYGYPTSPVQSDPDTAAPIPGKGTLVHLQKFPPATTADKATPAAFPKKTKMSA